MKRLKFLLLPFLFCACMLQDVAADISPLILPPCYPDYPTISWGVLKHVGPIASTICPGCNYYIYYYDRIIPQNYQNPPHSTFYDIEIVGIEFYGPGCDGCDIKQLLHEAELTLFQTNPMHFPIPIGWGLTYGWRASMTSCMTAKKEDDLLHGLSILSNDIIGYVGCSNACCLFEYELEWNNGVIIHINIISSNIPYNECIDDCYPVCDALYFPSINQKNNDVNSNDVLLNNSGKSLFKKQVLNSETEDNDKYVIEFYNILGKLSLIKNIEGAENLNYFNFDIELGNGIFNYVIKKNSVPIKNGLINNIR